MSSPGDLPTELTLERWTEGGVREGRWTVVSRLGQGESADVLCVRGDGGEELALKWARPGYEAFVGREARALARLGGVGAPRLDAVTRVGEPGRAERRMGLLMERIDGDALDVVSRKDASQASRRRLAQSVLLELGSTLRSLHSMGWAHGDVKPSNVMLAADGRVVLLDFGLSVPVQSSPRGGTPHYWPPELHGGTGCSARTADTFALGVLFAELDGLGSGSEGVIGSSWATALALPAVNERASLAFVLERAVGDWDVEGAARWRRAHLQHLYLAARWSELTWRCEAASALPELRLSGRPRAWLSAAARLLRELAWVESRVEAGVEVGIEARAEAGSAAGREPRNENESAVASAALGPLGPHDRSLFLARLVGPRACHFDFWGTDEDGAWIERLWSFAERAAFETLGPSILEGTAAASGAGAPESREAFLRDGEAPAPEWVVRDWGDDPVTWALGLRDRPPAAELLAHLERRDDLPDALRLEAARVLRRQGAYERAQALLAPGVGEAVELERGLVLARRGNLEAARESIERVASLALDDTSAHARAVLARWSLDRGDLEAARLRLADVGDSAPVCEVRALLALQEGDLARVEDQLTRGHALATQDEQAARLEGVRGMCEHQRGHGEKAHAAFTRAAELAARSLSVLEEATYLT
ncbi:MAG TPA: lipopolysaccharide kinase InaA family protein, partial [Polyangiaceae bacterium]|nr:lipopolysaccharide kinase InaA family protein [Polyangiaceae bacterium]